MQCNHNKQIIREAMKKRRPVIHNGIQYDHIVEYTILHDSGYAYVLLRRDRSLIFANTDEITLVESENYHAIHR